MSNIMFKLSDKILKLYYGYTYYSKLRDSLDDIKALWDDKADIMKAVNLLRGRLASLMGDVEGFICETNDNLESIWKEIHDIKVRVYRVEEAFKNQDDEELSLLVDDTRESLQETDTYMYELEDELNTLQGVVVELEKEMERLKSRTFIPVPFTPEAPNNIPWNELPWYVPPRIEPWPNTIPPTIVYRNDIMCGAEDVVIEPVLLETKPIAPPPLPDSIEIFVDLDDE